MGVVRAIARSDHWRWVRDAQMGPDLLKGDLELPTQDKPLEDLGLVCRRVGTEQCLGIEGALGISYQHPANGHRWLARAVPDGGL